MNEKAKHLEVDEERQKRIQHLREKFSELYDMLDLMSNKSREANIAISRLEEAQFWAIKGITREE